MAKDRPIILLVDDENDVATTHAKILERYGYKTQTTTSPHDALERAKSDLSIKLVLTDLHMPDIDGFTLLKEIKKIRPNLGVIIISVEKSAKFIVECVKRGAFNYVTKPVDKNYLQNVVAKYLETFKDTNEGDPFAMYQTQSKYVRMIVERSCEMADKDIQVLIRGETGTGKGVLARTIHHQSSRKNSPFVHVNCANLNRELVESELFGHAKGSFTGANDNKKGYFETAEDGTIFLDEIGELNDVMQAKLLQVLEDGSFSPVGSTEIKQNKAKVITATHKDIDNPDVFRQDLYHRIAQYTIDLPPLRDRTGDIPFLADYFLRQYSCDPRPSLNRSQLKGFSKKAMLALKNFPFPGNIRQLQNFVMQAILVTKKDDEHISLVNLPFEVQHGTQNRATAIKIIRDARKTQQSIDAHSLFKKHFGNVTKASQEMNKSRRTFRRLLDWYDDYVKGER